MKIKIKTGGGPDGSRATINFKDAINQNIFETGSDKLYFSQNQASEKKYITLHNHGILEYNGQFFMQKI